MEMINLLIRYQDEFLENKPHERLAKLRKINNLTVEKMSDLCAATKKSFINWEKGVSIPRKYNRVRIAEVLGVDEEVIFGTPKRYDFIKDKEDL